MVELSKQIKFTYKKEKNSLNNLFLILLIWNIIVMLIYGIDKIKARKGSHRISERTLILCAFLFGGFGAMFGMVVFNHKTSKTKFRTVVPLFTALEIAGMCFLVNLLVRS